MKSTLRMHSEASRTLVAWTILMLALAHWGALADQITLFDRIGANSSLSDNNPGGLCNRNPAAASNSWGVCAVPFAPPVRAQASRLKAVYFGARADATPINDFSAFSVFAEFFALTNGTFQPRQPLVRIPLGPGAAHPVQFGTTTNAGKVYPTCQLSADLSAANVTLEAAKAYAVALAFDGPPSLGRVRLSMSSQTGAPDLYADWRTPAVTNTTAAGFLHPQFALALTGNATNAIPPEPVALSLDLTELGRGIVSWPQTPIVSLMASTNAAASNWRTAQDLLGPSNIFESATNWLMFDTRVFPSLFFRLKQQ